MTLLDALHWTVFGLSLAFSVATITYYAWTFGLGARMRDVKRVRVASRTSDLRGRRRSHDPAEGVQQALHDALRDSSSESGAPKIDELWIPEVRPARRSETESRPRPPRS